MEKKVTKREVINAMLADEVVKSNEVWVGYLTNELALLDKKAQNKKPSKTQVANEDLKALILEVLAESEKPVTVTEMLATKRFEEGTTNQKLSSLLRQLVLDEKVVKTMDKKSAKFAVA
jgi:S-adenosylmethionine synthetase